MNLPDLLLDDALGRLEGEPRNQLDRLAAADPLLADRRARLRQTVVRLVDDGEDVPPPAGLASRTIAFVDDRRRRRTMLDLVPATVPFRWVDVAVAAAILLAGLLTLIPAIARDRARMAHLACMANLQQVGTALFRYASMHETYPYTPPDSPGAYVGAYALQLHDAGLIPDGTPLSCPSRCGSPPLALLIDYPTLCARERRAPGTCRSAIAGDYAYNVGYRRPSGRPGPIPGLLSATIPLLADQPPFDDARILPGNSPNHGGSGQNVLFSDLHVSWETDRAISPSDRDLFLNNASRPAPGLDRNDSVLVPSVFRYTGR
jgi:hypothetical protein